MTAEQLTLLDLESPPAAPRRRPRRKPAPKPETEASESGTAVLEVRYPEALDFLRAHGPEAMAVLHVLVVDADTVGGRLVVRASTRGVAGRLGFLSKDSVHRRLRQLRRAGVLDPLPTTSPTEVPAYVLHLDGTGLSAGRTD